MLQILVVLLTTCLPPVYSANFGVIPNPSNNLQVYALPVGQGDCTIIQCPVSGQLIINDCGSTGGAGLAASGVSAFLGNRVNNIVAIIISHADIDHYNYFPTLTSSANMNIQSVIIGGVLNDYPATNVNIRNWLNNFGARLRLINGGSSCIGTSACTVPGGTNFCNNVNIKFDILAANVGTTSNQKSIVLKVVSGMFNLLSPGDMEGPASITIANSPAVSAQLQSSIYKMAHHGASTLANQPGWLAPIRPQRAFASSAYNRGNCRHPRCEAINRIQALGTIVAAPSAHPFYCGNGGAPPTDNPAFTQHMYETSPSSNMICLLVYASDGTFDQSCMAPPAVALAQVSSASSGECFSMSNGAINRLHYPVVVVMLVTYVSLAL